MSDNVLIAEMVRLAAERDEAIAAAQFNSCRVEDLTLALDELRTILEPLLWRPYRDRDECLFCFSYPDEAHDDTCPVLRRDELLGRDRAPAHPEGDAT